MPEQESKNNSAYVRWGGDYGGSNPQLDYYDALPAAKPADIAKDPTSALPETGAPVDPLRSAKPADIAKDTKSSLPETSAPVDPLRSALESTPLPSPGNVEPESESSSPVQLKGGKAKNAVNTWRSAFGSIVSAVEFLEMSRPTEEHLSNIKEKLGAVLDMLTVTHDATNLKLDPEALAAATASLTELKASFDGYANGELKDGFVSSISSLIVATRMLREIGTEANPDGQSFFKLTGLGTMSANYWKQTLNAITPAAEGEAPASASETPLKKTSAPEDKVLELKDAPAPPPPLPEPALKDAPEAKPSEEKSKAGDASRSSDVISISAISSELLGKFKEYIASNTEVQSRIDKLNTRVAEVKEIITEKRKQVAAAFDPANDTGWMARIMPWIPKTLGNMVRAFNVRGESKEIKSRIAELRELNGAIHQQDREQLHGFRDRFAGAQFKVAKGNPENIPNLAVRASIPAEKVRTLLSFGRLTDEIALKHPDAAIEIDKKSRTITIHHENGNVLVFKHRSDGRVNVYARLNGDNRDAKPEFQGVAWTDDALKAANKLLAKGNLTFKKKHWEDRVIPMPGFLDTASSAPRGTVPDIRKAA